VVPIIDVFFEGDDFDAVEGLFSAEFLEERIRRRATGAAFGSEEFEDDGLFGGGGGLRGEGMNRPGVGEGEAGQR